MRSLFALTLLAASCSHPGEDPWGTGTGPGDGDRVPQDEACAQWIDCVAATQPARLAGEEATYGADGSCWESASEATDCAAECKEALEEAFLQFPQEPACDTGKVYAPGDILVSESEWVIKGTTLDDSCADYPPSRLDEAHGYLTLLKGDEFRFDFDLATVWGEGEGRYNESGGGYALCQFDFPFFTCDGSLDGPMGFGYEWAMNMQGAFEPPFDTLTGTMRIYIEGRCWIEGTVVGHIP